MIVLRIRCFRTPLSINSRLLSLRSHAHRWKRQKWTENRLSTSSFLFIPTSYKLPSLFSTFRGYNWGRRGWWNTWWERLVKSVNRRCLLCAGAIFLWDRERVTNQELSKSLSKYERRVGEKLFKSNQSPNPDTTANENNDNIELESQEKEKPEGDVENEMKQQKSKPKSKRQYRSTQSKTKPVKSNKKNVAKDKETKPKSSIAVADDSTPMNTTKKEPKQTVKEGVNTASDNTDPMEGWQLMSTQDNCKVYSKPYGDSGLSQYKVIGSYENITARDFLDVQVSDDRMSWDSYCLSLKTIDRDSSTGSEVIHWVTKFPFPMSNRDYVFVRRYWISPDDDAIVIVNRAVTHPSVPVTRKNIRVQSYFSEMVIKPNTFIDELGFNYELTYFDNPGSSIPSSAVAWATKSAMPDYLDKIYKAALMRLQTSSQHKHLT